MTALDSIKSRGAAAAAEAPGPVVRQPGIILILGAPRSGTSWLGKLFDSHPAVIYRHEPDAVLRPTGLPWLCAAEDIPRHIDATKRYITRLTSVRQLKASGTRPIFAKPFQPFPAPPVRRALAYGLRGAEYLMPRAVWPKRVAIPDLIRGDAAGLTYVIKSVSLLGNVALLARALPKSRIIAIFRHPCGQIASLKQGNRIGTMTGGLFGSGVLATARARALGFTREDYENLPLFEQCICGWAFIHAKVFEDVHGLENVHLLRYEDLCREPMQQMRRLAAFAGLPWDDGIARFIAQSTKPRRRRGYYSLFRDPLTAANKWKSELAADEIERYMAIVDRILPGMFRD